MANYAGLSYGNELICGTSIQQHLTSSGTLTGKTCSGIYGSGAVAGLLINGSSIGIPDGSTLDVIIKSVSGTLTNACFICSCHDCNNPDGAAARAVSIQYTGDTGTVFPSTIINPASPFTLIGSGYLNS